MAIEGSPFLVDCEPVDDPHPILSSFFDGSIGDRFAFKAPLFAGDPGTGSASNAKLEPFEEGSLLSLLTSPIKMDYDALAHPHYTQPPKDPSMVIATPHAQMSSLPTRATPLPESSSHRAGTREFLPLAPTTQPSPSFTSCSASPGLQPGRLFMSPPELQKTYSYTSIDSKPHPILSPPECSELSTAMDLKPCHPILSPHDSAPSPRAHPIMSATPSENSSEGDVKPHPIFGTPEPPPPPRQPQPQPQQQQQQQQQSTLRPPLLTQGGKKRGRDQGITALGKDGFSWLKYGEKRLSSARRTRAYFRCSKSKELDCPAKKFVDILEADPDGSNAMISYIQSHNHAKESASPPDAAHCSPRGSPSSEAVCIPATPRGVTVIGQLSAVASQKLTGNSSLESGRWSPGDQQQLGPVTIQPSQCVTQCTPGFALHIR